VYSRLQNARRTEVNGSVFAECTVDRLCSVCEWRAVVVSGNVISTPWNNPQHAVRHDTNDN
jgi:hypothetical protein